MKDLKNECVQCGDVWTVNTSYPISLDSLDHDNLANYDQLYSICEDCSDDGICESVEK